MPNHVANHIKFIGEPERIKEVLEAIKNDEIGIGSIDFNKIIPMPQELDIQSGSETTKGLKAYRDFVDVLTFDGANKDIDLLNIPEEKENIFLKQRTDISEEVWKLGRQAYRNILQYGHPTWYEWSINNWGTKWNAYDCVEYDQEPKEIEEIFLNTAWSAPHPILDKLASMYPDIEIEHEWSDEDFGYNLGRRSFRDGEEIELYIPETMKEAYEFALKVQGYESMEDIGLTLNAAETNYISIWFEDYDVVEFRDKHMLYTLERVTAADVPKGYNCYDIKMDSTYTYFDTLEKEEVIRHGGTLITKEEIDFGDGTSIDLENEPILFVGMNEVSFEQFENGEIELKDGMEMA